MDAVNTRNQNRKLWWWIVKYIRFPILLWEWKIVDAGGILMEMQTGGKMLKQDK